MPTNIRLSGSNTGFRSESDIRFNYGNLQQIIGSCNDLQNSTMEMFYSTTGGSSWLNSQLPQVTGDFLQSDPTVDWTSDGTAWALAIRVSSNPPLVANVGSFKSIDQGATWKYDSDLNSNNPNSATDKASLWIDHSASSPYKDNMYGIWWDGGPCFVAARNGPGGSWATPQQVSSTESSGATDGGDIKTNAFGDVFAFWPSSGNNKIFVAKSTDGGSSFGTPVQIASTNANFLIPIPAQASRDVLLYVTAGAYRTATGNFVYACWHDLAGGTGCNAASFAPGSTVTSKCTNRIWFSRSSDGGSTWETPYKINDQSSLNDQFFPRMVCDDTSGVIMVVYYDTIGNPDRLHTDIWMQTSTDNGVSWTNAVQVTTSESDEATSSANANQYGDYIGITGNAGNFFACWTDSRNSIEEIWGAPLSTTSIQLALNKSTYGKDEVGGGNSYAPAYWLEVTGFTNCELGLNNTAELSNQPSPTPKFEVTIDATQNSLTIDQINSISASLASINFAQFGPAPIVPTDTTLQSNTQTFFYPYTVNFTSGAVFSPLLVDEVAILTISASLTVGQITRTAAANIELTAGENPYFEDLNPADPAEYPSWLSFDLRFFKMAVPNSPGAQVSRFNANITADPADATTFIAKAIKNLTAGNGTVGSDGFEKLAPDEESTTIEFLPQDSHGNSVFNFAVARVRLKGNTVGATAQKVRVFFRLFQAQSTVTNFDTSTTYRFHSDGILDGVTVPLLGIQNNEYVTIPCFATPRVNLTSPADMSTQPEDTPNAYTINVSPGVEVDSFFGCWLDVNQPQQTFLPLAPPSSNVDGPFAGTLYSLNKVISRAAHQCLVAEIRFDDTPIPAGATSIDSDKIAQRNIAWIDGPNPGLTESRRMPHPFEIRATPASLSVPDELLIFWGNTPPGSIASFYLPAVSAQEILDLAGALYPEHRLTLSDAHTIQCPVGGATLIPIPGGKTRNAGLFTLDLPGTVHRGDKYTITIIQLTQGHATIFDRPNPRIEVALQNVNSAFTWRKVLGAFQVIIPIKIKSEILAPEENLLGWLRWIKETIPISSRWYPVFERYLGQVAGRVSGFGGDPKKILPSPIGIGPRHPGGPGSGHHPGEGGGGGHGSGLPGFAGLCYTGKVLRVVYDRFGDFEGFVLVTETGEFRQFRGREARVEGLVMRAWEERMVVTICVEPHSQNWPISIVLDRPH